MPKSRSRSSRDLKRAEPKRAAHDRVLIVCEGSKTEPNYLDEIRQAARISSARTDLLILDDWGPEKLSDDQRRDLLEIVEDRYERRSTIVTSQVPVDRWYEIIGNPTIADAILDRLVHNAYRIELSGESLRKQRSMTPPASAPA